MRLCPQCNSVLVKVERQPDSMYNQDQFDSQKAGDYYCKICKGNGRGRLPTLCYWWERETVSEQKKPTRNDQVKLWPLVMEDMVARDKIGTERYGTPLQPFNGRDFLRDLYEELLDAVVYCRGMRYELDQFRKDFAFLLIMMTQGNYRYAKELMEKMRKTYPFLGGES